MRRVREMDDIDYLLQHSDTDSTMVVIDSAKRNYAAYPTPSEYVMDFTQPFRFVHGIDVIDASIPASSFNIDYHNNRLCLAVARQPLPLRSDDGGASGAAALALVQGCLDELAASDAFDVHYRRTDYECRVLLLGRARSPEAPGLAAELAAGPASGAMRAPPQPTRYFALVPPTGAQQGQQAPALVELELGQAEYAAELELGGWLLDLEFGSVSIEMGNYSIDTLLAHLRRQLRPYSMDAAAASLEGGTLRRPAYRFTNFDQISGSSHFFLFDMNKSTCGVQLGFDLDADAQPHAARAEYSVLRYRGNRRMYGSLPPAPGGDVAASFLVPPGIVNLTGTRYLTLRCPEIESHLLGSFGSESLNVGLGVFKLSLPYEVTNLKFDFFNFVKKPFHPIGKLPRLTLRFERSDGKLYDFKGMNHQFLLSIKYYVPRMVQRTPGLAMPRSLLNPDYDPDNLRFVVGREQRLGDDDDDDSEYEFEGAAGAHELHDDDFYRAQDASRARKYMAQLSSGQ